MKAHERVTLTQRLLPCDAVALGEVHDGSLRLTATDAQFRVRFHCLLPLSGLSSALLFAQFATFAKLPGYCDCDERQADQI